MSKVETVDNLAYVVVYGCPVLLTKLNDALRKMVRDETVSFVDGAYCVSVSGDWKHDHANVRLILSGVFSYYNIPMSFITDWSSDSDCDCFEADYKIVEA